VAPVIRRATPGDADALSRIGRRTFVDTFGHLYPDEDLQDFLRESHGAGAYARFLADDRYALWLLEDDGEAVGYAVAGPCGLPHPEAAPGDGELKRLYLLPSLHNGGWGGRLFQVALDWLQRDGPRTLWISVWSENHGAQRFYARHGFQKAGEYEFPVGRVRDREFIFRRRAPAA
jgi:ribosomal protein S18 acetylase RimI-like enzyme